VALIPDQITRSVYSKNIAARFEMSEQIVTNELNKLRKGVISEQISEPEIRDTPHDIEPVDHANQSQQEINYSDDHNERDLMRKMIKYGPFAIETEQINDRGEKHKIETSVIELVCHELEKDELTFNTPLYNKLHQIMMDGLSENTLYKSSFFLRHEDQEIVKFVSEIESEEHEISPGWLIEKQIETYTELDKLQQAIMGSIYSFKAGKINQRINDIYQLLKEVDKNMDDQKLMDLLSEQMALEKVKKLISEKLGRIILR